jgi:hypothetical protein
MRRTGDVWVALALTALLAVGACSDPQAGPLPTTSATSPTLSTAPSTTPDLDAAASAVTYYATLERAVRDPSNAAPDLDRLIDARCACHQVVDLLNQLARDGHHLEFTVRTGPPRVARVTANAATVFLHVEQTAGREVDASGRVVRELPATTGDYAVDLVRRDGRWLVAQISKAQ